MTHADRRALIKATQPGGTAAIHRARSALYGLLEPCTAGDLVALAATVRQRLDLLGNWTFDRVTSGNG